MDKHDPKDEPIRLSPEQLAMVLEAEDALDRGEPTYSFDQVMDFAKARVRQWLPDQSA